MDPFSLDTLLICFGGGIVGAAMGGLFSFVICGLLVLSGCLVVLMGGSEFLLMQVGLGPIFGPHVGGFAAGVAASTYAAGVRKNHPGGAAKDILSALMNTSWDVLLVGGVFALFGHLLVQLFAMIPVINQTDVLALSVVTTAIIARVLFLREMPWGNAESIKKNGFLTNDASLAWIPWGQSLPKMVVFGLGAGLLSASMAAAAHTAMAPLLEKGVVSATGAFVVPLILGWGMAAVSLIALQLGNDTIQQVPVWHAQAILAAMAYLLFGSIALAAVVAVVATLLQDLMAKIFWSHGSNHIDPPACTIAFGTLVLNFLK
ncbi:hypothetical protein [Pseudodesulfovibrio sediminis]|uniref:DUF7973 domain-containing protein n=1 Tax=Pseudodesulfovibrio sediminis TaxID=2810563 RepID=A0ABN6EX50_9BACT|nr:hypothetical protein [Pseudodesulfovibrio sediminis]BCS89839.1 hypothetical protein PSDVSF_30810 [Pseudodesulfovibrio sediminis]